MSIFDLGSGEGTGTGADPQRYTNAIAGAFASGVVEARQSAPPTGLTDDTTDVGRAWIVEATASGDWSGGEGKVAVWLGTTPGWRLITAPEGTVFYVQDEDLEVRADGSDGWTGVTVGNVADGSLTPAKLVNTDDATWLGRLDTGNGAGPPGFHTIAQLVALLNDQGGIAPTALTGSGTLPTAALPAQSVTTARLQDDAVTNAKLADMAAGTVKGRAVGAGTGDPVDLSAAQVAAIYESNSDRNPLTDAEKTRLGVTLAWQGDWDPTTGNFPGGGSAQVGDIYIATADGTVDSIDFAEGDIILARTNNASTSTFAANWVRLKNNATLQIE